MLHWAARELLTPEGDFSAARSGFHRYHYAYSSCWFVWVAQVMGRFEISFPAMDYLLRFRSPVTGGFCSEAPSASGGNGEQDLLTTSFVSFVGLHLGRLAEAEAAAIWIERILDRQPDVRTRVWLRLDREGNLVTAAPSGCEDRRYYVLEVKSPEQYYYYLGSALIFLAKLYGITRNERHRTLAERIFGICLECHPDVFLTDGTGKVGLGSAYLFELTGERRYAQAAVRSCDFLVKDQDKGGYWVRGGKPTASSTAEFVVWLLEIVSALRQQGEA
jgi:hypothetical protein